MYICTTLDNIILFPNRFILSIGSKYGGVGGTVVSTCAFHFCDPGSIPAQCHYQIKIPPWLHVRRVFPV